MSFLTDCFSEVFKARAHYILKYSNKESVEEMQVTAIIRDPLRANIYFQFHFD